MKILVVGAGAMGGYYGARLIESGAEVSFLVRPARRKMMHDKGLRVLSDLGDFEGPVQTVLREQLQPVYDLIVLSCKGYDLESAICDIRAAVGPQTVLLPFLNGMGAYDALDDRFGKDRVLGGVAYIAVMLESSGTIRHYGIGDTVIVGSRSFMHSRSAQRFHALLSESRGTRLLSSDVARPLWTKWVMLASGAAMTCMMRGSISEILATNDGKNLMRQAMAECGGVAAREGYALSVEDAQQLQTRLLDEKSNWVASMMRDISQRAPRIEAFEIVGEMIKRAERHQFDVPLLRLAYCHLEVYQRQRLDGPNGIAL